MDLDFIEVSVEAAAWEPVVEWYREILGLPALLVDAPRRFALLGAGAARLALKGSDRGAKVDAVVLTFRVDDLVGQMNRLRGLGVEVEGPTVDIGEGYRSARLRDPSGLKIALFEWINAKSSDIGRT